GCTSLTSITIPSSVTSIWGASFRGCTSLTSITIPSSVTYIGEVAFRECANLTQVIIPNSVTFIGAGAFYGCTSLTSVAIPKSVTSIEEGAFGDCTGLISISVSATSIGIDAFSDCENLTSVAITNNVTSIEQGAFQGCASLSSITIPNSVTSIGSFAFSGCTSLTSITIPGSVTSIGGGAFDCEILEVSLENTIYDSRNNCNAIIETVTNTLVAGCKNTVIPNSVTAIGAAAFACSETLTSITIPNSVTTIGDYAFYECINLSSITIPNSVILLGCGLFEECTNLSTVYSLSKNPPVVSLVNEDGYEVSFDINGATVYVPSESVSAYKSAPVWKTLNIQPIPAENVSLSKDEVVVNVEKTTADFSMPANESANSYTLTIRNNGVTFCTLTFNANGQLTDIDFSTTKSYELKADVSAFKFTVTGLSEASDYKYSFKVLNASKAVLKEYVGSFTTKNADGTGGSTSGGGEGTLAIDNISPINTVAIVGNQILVNGEAPAFVYTIMGQKIANQNLKSGVYFVNVDGETVGISVR
ncbi:MAG: leucine-rich repeat domain-containing protein, partial [Bacteroidales bacterium]|nr:leucine-rich repeat domain-containing protein [Bacteroidales bacterium]